MHAKNDWLTGMPSHTRTIRRNRASPWYRITSTMGDLIRIDYYNSPLPIDRSRYRLQSLQARACALRASLSFSLSLPLSRLPSLTASLRLYFSVLNTVADAVEYI